MSASRGFLRLSCSLLYSGHGHTSERRNRSTYYLRTHFYFNLFLRAHGDESHYFTTISVRPEEQIEKKVRTQIVYASTRYGTEKCREKRLDHRTRRTSIELSEHGGCGVCRKTKLLLYVCISLTTSLHWLLLHKVRFVIRAF